jgi:hypothetical protein
MVKLRETSIHLEGDAQRATLVDRCSEPIKWRMRSSNRTISGTVVSAAGVAAGSWLSGLAFPALMPKSIYWTVATKQFNMRLCRYRGTDLVGVLTLLSWGWTSDGYVNGPPKSIYDER